MAEPEQANREHTLASALAGRRSEVVSLVGAGGKTSVLHLLAKEFAAVGDRVIATTTTAMFSCELAAVGPLLVDGSDDVLLAELSKTLERGRVAGVARAHGRDGKVVGLPPSTIDRLWLSGMTDHFVVEADGSRGLPLKAFGRDEPQVPDTTTTIVLVAGLDAIGRPLTGEYVHRAELLAAALGTPLGGTVTVRVFASSLQEQVRRLRQRWPTLRIATLLNKADSCVDEALGFQVASKLLGHSRDSDCLGAPCDRPFVDAVVVASLRLGRVTPFAVAEGRPALAGA